MRTLALGKDARADGLPGAGAANSRSQPLKRPVAGAAFRGARRTVAPVLGLGLGLAFTLDLGLGLAFALDLGAGRPAAYVCVGCANGGSE